MPVKNSFVLSEVVDFDLSNYDQWKMATIYLHRSKRCCGESSLDLVLDNKRLKLFSNQFMFKDAPLPRHGRFRCIYMVTRPTKLLMTRGNIEQEVSGWGGVGGGGRGEPQLTHK